MAINRMTSRDRQNFLDAKYGKQTPGMFRGTTFVSGKQLDEERALANELKLQNLKNTGQVDVARTTGEGYAEQQRLKNLGQRDVTGMEQSGLTKRTGLEQTGMTGRTNLEQSGMTGRNNLIQTGLDTRDKRDIAFKKRKLAGDQFKMLQEFGATNDLREKPINFGQRFNDFNTSRGIENGVSQTQSQYTPVERANGMTGYYDKAGKLAYTDLTDPDSVQSKTSMKYSGLQNLKANDLDSNGGGSVDTGYDNVSGQKKTNESMYGSKPTLKNIWAENARRKKERDVRRKSQWTVPY